MNRVVAAFLLLLLAVRPCAAAEMIILTATQADAVRGADSPGHALEPVLLADAITYVLPVAVLDDPSHAAKHDYLAMLPERDVAPGEFVQPTEN